MAGDPIFTKKRGTGDCDCTCQNYYASGDGARELKKRIDALETELAFQKRMTARHKELASRRKRSVGGTE